MLAESAGLNLEKDREKLHRDVKTKEEVGEVCWLTEAKCKSYEKTGIIKNVPAQS